MPITFNFDPSARRRQQQALQELEKQRQQSEALRQSAFGTISEGPPTRFGEQSIAGGQLQPQPFVEQLFADPSTSGEGIKQTLALMEQQRQAEQSQRDLAQQQSVLGGITQQDPGLANLAALSGLPAFQEQAVKALTSAVTPKDVLSGGRLTVAKSEIMENGLVQMVMSDGSIKVVTPSEENAQLIEEAQIFGAEMQRLRSSERTAGTNAQKASLAAFTKLPGIRNSVALYDRGIELLKTGAGTGPIEKMFPSFKAASVELNNVQANLGLNVIQNTTFGSLSAEELAFALDTTIPKGLNEPELIAWMTRKRSTQDKLAKYLEETAIFLGTPGNTIAKYLQSKRTGQFVQQTLPTTPLPQVGGQAPPPPPGFK